MFWNDLEHLSKSAFQNKRNMESKNVREGAMRQNDDTAWKEGLVISARVHFLEAHASQSLVLSVTESV